MPEDAAVPEDDIYAVPPASVDPTSTDSSVEPSSAQDESPNGTDAEAVVLPEFDPQYRLAFEGLLFIF